MHRMLRNKFTRLIAWILTIATTTLSLPVGAFTSRDYKKSQTKQRISQHYADPLIQAAKKADIQLLSDKEMHMISGRGGRNPYACGLMPWQRDFHGVNTCTGNLMKTFTDIQAAPARGAGLILSRNYNSNDETEGPFGKGWTHAYDMRVAEAVAEDSNLDGIINANERDGSVRIDSFGGRHRYGRDADGLYTPPPYSQDFLASNYGSQTVLNDVQTGNDGTVKHFILRGAERVCDSITDRHGNETTLEYSSFPNISRELLTRVTDPSGRHLYFVWEDLNPGNPSDPKYRVRYVVLSAEDISLPVTNVTSVTNPEQTVSYDYYNPNDSIADDDDDGNEPYTLKAVHLDPDGLDRVTTFKYKSVVVYNWMTDETDTCNGLLSQIIDTSGNIVSYDYIAEVEGRSSYGLPWLTVKQIIEPGGVDASNTARNIAYDFSFGVSFYYGWAYFPRDAIGLCLVEGHNATENPHASCSIYNAMVRFFVSFDNKYRFLDVCEYDRIYQDYATSRRSVVYDSANNPTHKYNIGYDHLDELDKYTTGFLVQEDIFEYNTFGNVTSHRVAGYPGEETYEYWNENKYFQKKTFTDMNGNTTTYNYGTSEDPIGKRGELLEVWDACHNPGSNPDSPTNHVSFRYDYNEYGQKTQETNTKNVVTQYTYGDTWGNLTQVVQDYGGIGRTTSMFYDLSGRVTSSTDPEGQTKEVLYNKLGQPTTATFKFDDQSTEETVAYDYGNNGQLESVSSDVNGSITLNYEPGGTRVSSIEDSEAGTTSYTYTLYGSVETKTLPDSKMLTYIYNTSQKLPSSMCSTDYRHFGWLLPGDDLNSMQQRLTRIVDDQGRIIDYLMNSNGSLLQVRFNQSFDVNDKLVSYYETKYYVEKDVRPETPENMFPWDRGEYYTNQYDTRGLLDNIETNWITVDQQQVKHPTLIAKNEYAYDDAGNRLTNTSTIRTPNGQLQSAVTDTYTYDELYRLETVSYGQPSGSQTYAFDNMGNRSSLNGVTYTYNSLNILTQSSNGIVYENDDNGNRTIEHTGNPLNPIRTFDWDSQNRMTQCVNYGTTTTTSTFTYGPDGLRRSMSVNGGTPTRYIWDGKSVAQEWVDSNSDSNVDSNETTTYLNGLRGSEYRQDSSGQVRWYLYDGLGSVIGELDSSGNVTTACKYDVYGGVRWTNPDPDTSASKHKFVGQLGHTTEESTGNLIYMQARWYDPVTGRFISEDPAKHGTNWFVYCNNNPVNLVDPDGQMPGLVFSALMCLIALAITLLVDYYYLFNGKPDPRNYSDETDGFPRRNRPDRRNPGRPNGYGPSYTPGRGGRLSNSDIGNAIQSLVDMHGIAIEIATDMAFL